MYHRVYAAKVVFNLQRIVQRMCRWVRRCVSPYALYADRQLLPTVVLARDRMRIEDLLCRCFCVPVVRMPTAVLPMPCSRGALLPAGAQNGRGVPVW